MYHIKFNRRVRIGPGATTEEALLSLLAVERAIDDQWPKISKLTWEHRRAARRVYCRRLTARLRQEV
jgi:hypothetical protein